MNLSGVVYQLTGPDGNQQYLGQTGWSSGQDLKNNYFHLQAILTIQNSRIPTRKCRSLEDKIKRYLGSAGKLK
jgi:hypothetical protein